MRKGDLSAAVAVAAASAGTGFASGREIVLFFSQMGRASWIGVACAAAMFGMLCGLVCRAAKQTGGESFRGVCLRVLGVRRGMVAGAAHGLLMAVTAGRMIIGAGEMAALVLPVKHAFLMGALLSVGTALLLCMRRMRRMVVFGTVTAVLCALFYASLALDPRKVRIYRSYETVAELSGSVSAALVLAMLHAALNASVACGVTCCFSSRVEKPFGFGMLCGGLMLIMLSAANAAVMRGGAKLLSQALPTVVLAARWGVFGYYAAISVMWLCDTATLAAAIGALTGEIGKDSRLDFGNGIRHGRTRKSAEKRVKL